MGGFVRAPLPVRERPFRGSGSALHDWHGPLGGKKMHWDRVIDTLRADNTSGAAELARAAALAALEWIDGTAPMPPHAWKQELSARAPGLYTAQPAMAPLFNLVNAILLTLESATTQEEVQPRVRGTVQAFLEYLSRAPENLAAAALRLLSPGARILTCSYSSTVLGVLLAAHARRHLSVVFCTESRPMLEGQRLTRELAKAGIRVEFGVDAAVTGFTERADMALVGADSVSAGGVVNKLGTTGLALACRHTGTPCYVVADRHKWFPAGAAAPALGYLKPAGEVWPDPPAGVAIWNAYFECTPTTLFSGIIGEDGLRSPEDLRRELLALPVAQALRSGASGGD
jgi:translation initiation factor 2B subunit (eIF-2B alpha/beta/delta family)